MSKAQNPLISQILDLLDELQAIDISTIDVHEQTPVTDYMIIAGGRASRHVKSMGQNIMEKMKKAGHPALSCTGLETGDWVLIDFGDAIVHLMQNDSRHYYNLEGLWATDVQNQDHRTGS